MRVKYSRTSKIRDYRHNILFERGKHFDNLQVSNYCQEIKITERKRIDEERAEKIKEIINLFNDFFAKTEFILNLMQSNVFSLWEKYHFVKDIPQALIQIEYCLKNNGYEKEWSKWNSFVQQKL